MHANRLTTFGVITSLLASAPAALAQCGTQFSAVGGIGGVAGGVGASTLWDPDGPGPAGSALVAGGAFSSAGTVAAANIAMFDFASGTWSALGLGVDGTVHALAVLPTGELVAAGAFATAGGQPAARIARWDGTTWAPLGAGLSGGEVESLAVLPNGHLVAGGTFQTSGSVGMSFVAEWDGVAWAGIGNGPGGVSDVRSLLALPNGDLIAGTSDYPTASVLRWNGTAWSSIATMTSQFTPPDVRTLALLPNGDVVAGGDFLEGTSGASNIAKWNGASWSRLSASTPSGIIFDLAVTATGALVLAGDFRSPGNLSAPPVLTWNGASFVALGVGLTGAATSLVPLPTGDLIAGGGLTLGGPSSHARLTGSAWSSLSPVAALDRAVLALTTLPTGELVAGGQFRFAGGIAVNGIARFDGSTWSAFGPGLVTSLIDSVNAVAVLPNGDVVAGGSFSSPGNGSGREGIARWNGTSWTAMGAGPAEALAVMPNGDLVAAGPNGVARWDGSIWSALGSFRASALAVLPNGDLVAGGLFTSAGGAPASNIARWDGTSWHPLGGGTSGFVGALAVMANGDLVAGGAFSAAGGVPATNVARWDGSTWSPIGSGIGDRFTSTTIYSLHALPGGGLLAGGEFSRLFFNSAIHNITRWNGTAWTQVGTSTGLTTAVGTPDVRAFATLPGGGIAVGGLFQSADGQPSLYLTTVVSTCPASAIVEGQGCVGPAGMNVLTATQLPWTGGTFTSIATGLPAGSLAALVFGFQPLAIPLATLLPQGGPGCALLTSPDSVAIVIAPTGTVNGELAIPRQAGLIGAVLRHQVVAADVGPSGTFGTMTSTNALVIRVGSF